MAIAALDGNKELYEELLLSLQVAALECQGIDPTHFVDLDNDEDTPLQQGAVNLCE
jgi:hypothetical protein